MSNRSSIMSHIVLSGERLETLLLMLVYDLDWMQMC